MSVLLSQPRLLWLPREHQVRVTHRWAPAAAAAVAAAAAAAAVAAPATTPPAMLAVAALRPSSPPPAGAAWCLGLQGLPLSAAQLLALLVLLPVLLLVPLVLLLLLVLLVVSQKPLQAAVAPEHARLLQLLLLQWPAAASGCCLHAAVGCA
jgi:hypothetical protein